MEFRCNVQVHQVNQWILLKHSQLNGKWDIDIKFESDGMFFASNIRKKQWTYNKITKTVLFYGFALGSLS